MAAFTVGPCSPWITGDDLDCSPIVDPLVLDTAAAAAVDVLFHLSGMQFTGVCTYTVRPGYRKCDCGTVACGLPFWAPGWTGYGGGLTSRDPFVCCDCTRARLGFGPIASITSVEIDGVPLNAAEYAVDEYAQLVRLDGTCWPLDDTWEVVFTSGVAPPASGLLAAKILGCEIAKLLGGSDGCQLPQRVTQLTRQGVSMIFDPMDFLDNGRTGIYAVDLFLATHNPDNLHSTPIVAIPNQPTQVIRHT